MFSRVAAIAFSVVALFAVSAGAGDLKDSLKKGTPDLKSAGALTFGPEGILFVGDTQGAALFALDTGDRTPRSSGTLQVSEIDQKVAALLGTDAKQVAINDLAVNPASGRAYLAVSRGRGPDAAPVIVRLDAAGNLEMLALEGIAFAKAMLPNPPSPEAQQRGRSLRQESITDLAYVDGRVYVAGLSNEEFSSRFLAIPFPFSTEGASTSVEIYHGAHGGFETKSPVRTFVPFNVGGDPHLLAAYTCTPLVMFPLSQLKPNAHLKGRTVAELGNRNRPLDMIAYKKDGKEFLLLANSNRGVMKVSTDGIDAAESITAPVPDGSKRGQGYETLAELKGVMQLDRLSDTHALVLVQAEGGAQSLESIPLP